MTVLKRIYKELASKHGLTEQQVEEIVVAQFMFVKKTMAEGVKNEVDSFKNIQLTHLGKFAVRRYKIEEYKNKANGKHTRNTGEED